MPSDLAVFLNGATLPVRRGELDDLTKSLMGGSTYKRISLRGGLFRMIVNGKEVAVNEDRAMNVIIVAAAQKTSRAYYATAYTENTTSEPDCQSSNGDVPNSNVPNPQASRCSECPQNIKGSGIGDSRACRFSRRLAVVLENDLDSGDVYQLVLPAKSLFGTGEANKMPLEQYAKFMAGHGISVTAVVTEMRFDTSADTPKLTFRAVRPLTDEELDQALVLGRSKNAIDAITYDTNTLEAGATSEQKQEAPKKPKEEPVVFKEHKVVEKPAAPVAAQVPSDEPVKRESKKAPAPEVSDISALLDEWDDE